MPHPVDRTAEPLCRRDGGSRTPNVVAISPGAIRRGQRWHKGHLRHVGVVSAVEDAALLFSSSDLAVRKALFQTPQ